MKKIVLLMFGLLFTGVFSIASANGVVMDKIGIECKSSIDGGDLFAPSEILEAKAITKEAEIPICSKRGNKLNINGVVYLSELPPFGVISKRVEVGWQGYTDA